MIRNSEVKASFSYSGLRDWIAQADAMGELEHITGAGWEEEIGMATELVTRRAINEFNPVVESTAATGQGRNHEDHDQGNDRCRRYGGGAGITGTGPIG